MDTKVVVTGMGVVSPSGNDLPTFWKNVCAGKSCISTITRWDPSALPTQIAGLAEPVELPDMSSKDLRRRDLYTIYAMYAADQAWKHSGLDINTEDPERCGTIVGSGIGGIQTLEEGHEKFLGGGYRQLSPLTIPKLIANMGAGEVAIRLGLRGPNKSIVTACATGAQSISEAARTIQYGTADVMVCGGAEASITPFGMGGFCAMKAMSRRNDEPERASRPFDTDRDGFVMGEGAGVLVLESEAHARKRGAQILGVVAGSGETCDAYHITAPRPDGSGAAGAMRAALKDARINASDVGYFNAHGTSTKHNDAGESVALRSIFGESMPPVSSTKSMMGHLLGAAGAVEAIICLMAIEHGILPPNINYETPDPECAVNLVANEAREAKVAIAMSNSLGFGGHNASLLLMRYDGNR
ncbi:MAG TPA: beta-ketoacyl-ACP synthase II [Candidatus Hydrogenedentes bacterium]|nr:beta-ketoacyl-ACP synthase II [Candidatus Hydrogenedentota bacterium]HRK33696.1 beta-ketoacyl-ACP synthase II [Candidatus Hydrogenedentota bacterium]